MVKLLVYFLIFILPLGQLTRLPINRGEIGVYLHDLVIILILFIWGFKKLLRKEKIIWPQLTRPIFSFAGLAVFSLFLAVPLFKAQELLVSSFYLCRWLAYAGFYLVLYDLIKHQSLTISYKPLVAAGTLASILGLIQYFLLPDIRPLTQFGWDPHYFRIVGSFLDPGFTGLIYVLTLALLIPKKEEKKNLIQWLIFLIVYSALALTYARSAYLAYLVVMTIIAWYKKSTKFFLAVILWFIITIALLPRPSGEGVRLERHSTIFARLNNYQQTIEIAWEKPLFGWGFNTYRYLQKNLGLLDKDSYLITHSGAGADSSLLFVLAVSGILGLIGYLVLFQSMLKNGEGNINIVASLAAVLIHSFFNNSFFYAWVMIWLWLILAIKENRKQ